MKLLYFNICCCVLLSCTRSYQNPNTGTYTPGNANNYYQLLPIVKLSFDDGSATYTPPEISFEGHCFFDSASRYYAIKAYNGEYATEVRFKTDSLSFFSGQSLSVRPAYFSISRYGVTSIATSASFTNVTLTVQMKQYLMIGSLSGTFYNQENGKRSDVSIDFDNLSPDLNGLIF